jgi:hypothetical protein
MLVSGKSCGCLGRGSLVLANIGAMRENIVLTF